VGWRVMVWGAARAARAGGDYHESKCVSCRCTSDEYARAGAWEGELGLQFVTRTTRPPMHLYVRLHMGCAHVGSMEEDGDRHGSIGKQSRSGARHEPGWVRLAPQATHMLLADTDQ